MKQLLELISQFPSSKDKLKVLLRWYICPFDSMEVYLPKKGLIIDVGCGEGILALFVARKSTKREVIGIDIDPKKITIAQNAAQKANNLHFKVMNVLNWNRKVDGLVLSDALHHLTPAHQDILFNKIKNITNKDAIVVIKEINKDDRVRSSFSRIWDFILYPQDVIHYWSKNKLINKMEKLGFKVIVYRKSLHFPGSTLVYVCTKQ